MGMITAHGYIDNPTFRGMRWHLRNTFDTIYVLDLHGNSNKKETAPDGSKDENVFNIKTGVSIILGVKRSNNVDKKLATIYKSDLFGLRDEKFRILNSSNIETILWKELPQETDLWLLEGKEKEKYKMGFSVADIFPVNNTGICTQRDQVSIQDTVADLKNVLDDFNVLGEDELKIKYAIEKDGRDWKIKTAKEDVIRHYVDESLIKKVESSLPPNKIKDVHRIINSIFNIF
jgi:predicted helicase